jgi:hypothetical protein
MRVSCGEGQDRRRKEVKKERIMSRREKRKNRYSHGLCVGMPTLSLVFERRRV